MNKQTDADDATSPAERYQVEGRAVVPHVLLSADVVLEGVRYRTAPGAGLATYVVLGISGFVWPYVRADQPVDEPPTLWFMVRGFAAPQKWIDMYSQLQAQYLANVGQGQIEQWAMLEHVLKRELKRHD